MESVSLIIASAVGALAAAAAAAIDPVNVNDAAAQIISIIDDTKLRLVCLSGALGGAVLSVGLFPTTKSADPTAAVRELAVKLLCSTIAGIIFTPIILRWRDIRPETDYVLAASGIVALLSWSILQIAVPRIIAGLGAWIATKTDSK